VDYQVLTVENNKNMKWKKNAENFVAPRSSDGNIDKKSPVKDIVVQVEVCDLKFGNTNNIDKIDDNVKINELDHCSNGGTSDAGKNDTEKLVRQEKKIKRLGIVKDTVRRIQSKDKKEHSPKPYQHTDKLKKNLYNNLPSTCSSSASTSAKKPLGLKQEIKEPTLLNVDTRANGYVTVASRDRRSTTAGTVRSNNSNFDSSGYVEINHNGQYNMSDMGQLNIMRVEGNNNSDQPVLRATTVDPNITSPLHYSVYSNNNNVLERQNQLIETTMNNSTLNNEHSDNYLRTLSDENRNQYPGRQNYYDLGSSFNNNYYRPDAQDRNDSYLGNVFDEHRPYGLLNCSVPRNELNNSVRNNGNIFLNARRTIPHLVDEILSTTQDGNLRGDWLCPMWYDVRRPELLNENVTTAIRNAQNGTFNSGQLYFQQYPELMTNFDCISNVDEDRNNSVSSEMTLPQGTLPSALTVRHHELAYSPLNIPNVLVNAWLINQPHISVHHPFMEEDI